MIKQAFRKNPLKKIYYGNHKKFNKKIFKNVLNSSLNGNIGIYSKFIVIFIRGLEKHAALTPKKISENHSPYMKKDIIMKTKMKRTQLQTKCFKTKTQKDCCSLPKQRNYFL